MFGNLTAQEEASANAAAGTVLGTVFCGAASFLKGVGFVAEKSTSGVATGLRWTADRIEGAGSVTSGFCYDKAEYLEMKAKEYKGINETMEAALKEKEKHNGEITIDQDIVEGLC